MSIDLNHLKDSVLKHWVSTLAGVGVGAYELLARTGLDFTSMPWPELRARILKALFWSVLGAVVRIAKPSEASSVANA